MLPVFIYGTLQFACVRDRILDRRRRSVACEVLEPATLDGFAAWCVRGAPYPVLRPDPQARARGMLWRGLGAGELATLDDYEGELYRRDRLGVRTCSALEPAWVWRLATGREDALGDSAWDRGAFAHEDLEAFVRSAFAPGV